MLNSRLWLVATVSDTTELENISIIIGRSTEGHSLENYTPPTFLFFFFLDHTACRILLPWPGIEPMATAVKVPSPNQWTAREFFVFPFCTGPSELCYQFGPWVPGPPRPPFAHLSIPWRQYTSLPWLGARIPKNLEETRLWPPEAPPLPCDWSHGLGLKPMSLENVVYLLRDGLNFCSSIGPQKQWLSPHWPWWKSRVRLTKTDNWGGGRSFPVKLKLICFIPSRVTQGDHWCAKVPCKAWCPGEVSLAANPTTQVSIPKSASMSTG